MQKEGKKFVDMSIQELKEAHSDSLRLKDAHQNIVNQLNSQIQNIVNELALREQEKDSSKNLSDSNEEKIKVEEEPKKK